MTFLSNSRHIILYYLDRKVPSDVSLSMQRGSGGTKRPLCENDVRGGDKRVKREGQSGRAGDCSAEGRDHSNKFTVPAQPISGAGECARVRCAVPFALFSYPILYKTN